MSIVDGSYIVTMPDNSRWKVPVKLIAMDRAKCFVNNFGGDIARSLEEDTWLLFEGDQYEIKDWARNNMNWDDVRDCAEKMSERDSDVDYQEGWVNGEAEIV